MYNKGYKIKANEVIELAKSIKRKPHVCLSSTSGQSHHGKICPEQGIRQSFSEGRYRLCQRYT